jgi:spermidine synthase
VLAAVLLAAGAAALVSYRGDQRARVGAGACVAAMGFTLLGLQVMLLLAFQCVYGYVYQQIALLVAAFMAGLAAGSRLSIRRFHKTGTVNPVQTLLLLQLAVVILPIVCVVVFVASADLAGSFMAAFAAYGLFPAMAFVSGGMGGYQFPVASSVYFGRGTTRRPGAVYALDITGAFAGAVLVSGYLVPVFGFLNTAIVLAIFNTAPVIVLAGARTNISGDRVRRTRSR